MVFMLLLSSLVAAVQVISCCLPSLDGSFPGVLRIQEIARQIQSDIYVSYVARFSFLNGNRMLTASGLQVGQKLNSRICSIYRDHLQSSLCGISMLVSLFGWFGAGMGGTMKGA